MKKEKIIKTHTRKTKSGKIVTVRQHTAKYDAAEEAKKLAKKIGAGKEFQSKKAIEKTPKYTATSDLYDKETHGEFLKKLRNEYDISKVFTDKRKKWRTVTIYGSGNNSRPFGGKEEEVKKAISRQYPGAKIQKIDKKNYGLSGFRVYLPHKKDN